MLTFFFFQWNCAIGCLFPEGSSPFGLSPIGSFAFSVNPNTAVSPASSPSTNQMGKHFSRDIGRCCGLPVQGLWEVLRAKQLPWGPGEKVCRCFHNMSSFGQAPTCSFSPSLLSLKSAHITLIKYSSARYSSNCVFTELHSAYKFLIIWPSS